MAKHDQRILKFLNQNVDQAPTITDLMTRLGISISDISDALNTMVEQGLVAKRTNNQGIECWIPTTGQSAVTESPTSKFATGSMRAMGQPEVRTSDSNSGPVPVQHIPTVERAASQTRSFPSMFPTDRIPHLGSEAPATTPPTTTFSFPQPATKGVSFLTLVIGLIATAGLSVWLASRLTKNEIHRASGTFVSQQSLTDANAASIEFQKKTKSHITALEDQVKKLNEQLATSQAAAESLKVMAAAPPPKVEKISKAEAAKVKAKAGKKNQLAKSAKASALVTKASTTRKKKAAPVTKSEGSEYGSSVENTSPPNTPEPPRSEEQDLPPLPSE